MYTQNEYEELLRAYRLIGRTVFPTKGKRVEMRFETFYGAYVKRREEIKILQQNKGIINLNTNNVYDFIEFSVCLEKHTMKISIKYENLKLCIPTNTVIYQIEEDDNNSITSLKRLRKLEKYFKETSLLKAFDNVFVDAS
ncbi:8380_t:CDS:2 [Diversispora eburnea]|uniref:8380_t:CDS:1 n=1 Tax=Diversispora eburnea TaxID=1213867 RepID=A0A9N9FXY8_9GLOM|nr:8380_t:CDS:2 [Diversispora eburnea]